MTAKAEKKHLQYLDRLRESGETNMYGAGEYLEAAFDMQKQDARDILAEWMSTFSDRVESGEVEV